MNMKIANVKTKEISHNHIKSRNINDYGLNFNKSDLVNYLVFFSTLKIIICKYNHIQVYFRSQIKVREKNTFIWTKKKNEYILQKTFMFFGIFRIIVVPWLFQAISPAHCVWFDVNIVIRSNSGFPMLMV